MVVIGRIHSENWLSGNISHLASPFTCISSGYCVSFVVFLYVLSWCFFVEFRKVYHLITPLKCVSPGPDHLCLFVWYFLSRYHICNICICICAIYCYFVNLIFRIQPQFTHYLFLTIVIFVFEFEIFLVTVFLAEKTDYHFESSCFWWFKIYN